MVLERAIPETFSRWQRYRSRKHDPEIIINEALRTMHAHQIQNREKAVHAITLANHLRIVYFRQRRVVAEILKSGRRALKRGDERTAADLMKRAGQERKLLRQLGKDLTDASEQIAHIKRAIVDEESTFRKSTARALAMKNLIELAHIEAELHSIDTEIEREYGITIPPKGPGRPDRKIGSRRAR
jgi:phage shock protein A